MSEFPPALGGSDGAPPLEPRGGAPDMEPAAMPAAPAAETDTRLDLAAGNRPDARRPNATQGGPPSAGRLWLGWLRLRQRQQVTAALLSALVVLLVVSALLGAVVGSGRFAAALSSAALSPAAAGSPPPLRLQPTPVGSTTIAQENGYPGTTDWMVPPAQRSTTQIQAYLSATSVRPGAVLSVFVSVQTADTPFSIDVFRLGWYGGKGARRLFSTAPLVGEAQGYYDPARGKLVNCVSCYVDGWLGLIEANWRSSYQLTIPSDWLTGVYLAKVTDAHGFQTWATFDVLGHDHATYVMVTSDTTVAAYNEWGGASLYLWRLQGGLGGHARKVSLDRPIAGWGDEQGLAYELGGIRWLERNGYDVAYMSSVDLHEHPEQLLNHRAYLVFGHDEYWSAAMRDGVEQARDAGVGLGFFGGNIGYWQIRFEPDSHGEPNRTIVNYKEAYLDPLLASDRAHVTTQWRDPIVGRPENALIGVMYAGFATQPRGFAWRMGDDSASPLLHGTGLMPGRAYGCDLVGYEWDSVYANGRSPSGLRVLSASPTLAKTGIRSLSNTTSYVARSGALVFAAGTIDWPYALDDVRLVDNPECVGRTQPVPELQALTANVMAALAPAPHALTPTPRHA
jgi:hypothetical protein